LPSFPLEKVVKGRRDFLFSTLSESEPLLLLEKPAGTVKVGDTIDGGGRLEDVGRIMLGVGVVV